MPDPNDCTRHAGNAFAQVLAQLPAPAAPADGWLRLQATLAARRRRNRLRGGVPLAAAALLALALLPQWQGQAPPATAEPAAAIDAAPAPGASALDQAIAANQALEIALRGAARPALLDGRSALASAELEDLIGMLDLQLSDTPDDARASALWRQRALLLEELAGLRTGAGVGFAELQDRPGLVPSNYTIN
jgi:hypothetical protein